jgi:tetratricopeptide (TPR) repeat protein
MVRNILTLGLAWSLVAVAASPALARERVERTGSRLATNATQRTVYRFSESQELRRVLNLIEQGAYGDAVELARDYVDSLNSAMSVNGSAVATERYYGLNALCVALMKAGGTDEALDACNRAIEIFPRRWTALNSRGTAHYAMRAFDRALEDYRGALADAPANDEQTRAMIEHNIELTEAQFAEADLRR